MIKTVNELEARLEDIREPIDVSVIGCVVNGPGEALVANIGLTGGRQRSLLYVNGEMTERLENATLVDQLEANIRAHVAAKQQQIPIKEKA